MPTRDTKAKDVSAPPAARWELPPYDRQNSILQAALELFVQHGYRHTTIRQIAQKLDIAPSLIIYYFGNKHTIALAYLKTSLQRLLQQIAPRVDIQQNPELFCCSFLRLFQTVMSSPTFCHFYHDMIEERLFHEFFFTDDGTVNSCMLILDKRHVQLSPLQRDLYTHYIMPSIEMALWIAAGDNAPAEETRDLSFQTFMSLLQVPKNEIDAYCQEGKKVVDTILESHPEFLTTPFTYQA